MFVCVCFRPRKARNVVGELLCERFDVVCGALVAPLSQQRPPVSDTRETVESVARNTVVAWKVAARGLQKMDLLRSCSCAASHHSSTTCHTSPIHRSLVVRLCVYVCVYSDSESQAYEHLDLGKGKTDMLTEKDTRHKTSTSHTQTQTETQIRTETQTYTQTERVVALVPTYIDTQRQARVHIRTQ